MNSNEEAPQNMNHSDFIKEFRRLMMKYDLRPNDDIEFHNPSDCGGGEFYVVAHDDPAIVVALRDEVEENSDKHPIEVFVDDLRALMRERNITMDDEVVMHYQEEYRFRVDSSSENIIELDK